MSVAVEFKIALINHRVSANNDLLRRDGIKFSTTEPEGQPLIGRERDRAGGFVDGSYNVAARTAGEWVA